MSNGFVGLVVVVIVVLIVLMLLISCIKIVPQARAMVVERLGAYQATWSTGLHFKCRSSTGLPDGLTLKSRW